GKGRYRNPQTTANCSHQALWSQENRTRGRRSRLYYPHLIHTTASNINPPILRSRHVPHHTASRRNVRLRKPLRLWIEPHHRIRLHARFAVPHHPIRSDRNPIRIRLRPTRRVPQFHSACRRIQPSQASTLEIR